MPFPLRMRTYHVQLKLMKNSNCIKSNLLRCLSNALLHFTYETPLKTMKIRQDYFFHYFALYSETIRDLLLLLFLRNCQKTGKETDVIVWLHDQINRNFIYVPIWNRRQSCSLYFKFDWNQFNIITTTFIIILVVYL